MRFLLLGLGFITQLAFAANPYVYVGRLTATSAILAWGTAEGSGKANTIGREAESLGPVEVEIGSQKHTTQRAWIDIRNLQPDTVYPYSIKVHGAEIGHGILRTWPSEANRLRFFVLGDYGNGESGQYAIARAMDHRLAADPASPPRFVLTTGDNIYGFPLGIYTINSGDRDRHWRTRFFEPYRNLLGSVPFYPSLGNHDGNQSDNKGDLATYLDNFFFPGDPPSRYYNFSIGGNMAEFFALDSTNITGSANGPSSPQFLWLKKSLELSKARWKIVYFHHPPYNAGPLHGASLKPLKHWMDLFERTGVQIVFNGHEHNFQHARHGGIDYFLTGAGGELRKGDIAGKLAQAGVDAFLNERHFLEVILNNDEAEIRLWGAGGELKPLDQNHRPVPTPFHVPLNRSQ